MAQVCGFDVEHLHGPEEISYARDELVVVCLARDGLPWVRSFVEHYFDLGAKHLVFLDNGSTDGTVEALKDYDRVTVLRTRAPFREYEDPMRRYLMERFGWGRWCLCVDIDELFDYPYSDVVSLRSLLGYLNRNSYTAVVAQMLDMFPWKLSSGRETAFDEPLKELHRFYDLSNLSSRSIERHHRCPPDNIYAGGEIKVFKGGVRKTIFGFNPLLTKHPLVFLDGKTRPISPGTHWASSARVADLTCVLYHYKFVGEYLHEVAARTVRGGQHRKNLGPYEKYLDVLEKNPNLQVGGETSRELSSVKDLLAQGFLTVSADYMSWMSVEEERRFAQTPSPNQLHSRIGTSLEFASREGTDAAVTRAARQQLSEPQQSGRPPRKKVQKRKGTFTRDRDRHDVPDSPFLEKVQKWILHHNVRLLHGPGEVACEVDELIVLALVRDGRSYVKSFVEHYKSLGAKHIVFLDNGSIDGTVEALSTYEGVTVFQTKLPFKKYGISMRQYLVERFGRGRWTLNVDIDELFVYPYSDVVGIGALLRYLNENSYTAVVANMLDMFPEEPLSEVVDSEDDPLKELCRFYDLSNIGEEEYDRVGDVGNVLANRDVAILMNGIRHTLFRTPGPLIKHPLIFLDDRLKPMDLSEHWVGNAHIADFTGTLLHYRLLNRLFETVRREVENRSYPNRGGKYDKYLTVLDKASYLAVKTETARELESPDDLIGTRFMVLSEEYLRLVEKEDRSRGDAAARHTARLSKAFLQAATQAAEGSRKLSDAQKRLNERTREVRKLQRQVEELKSVQQQLEGVVNSRSWRLLDGINRARKRLRARIGHVVGR